MNEIITIKNLCKTYPSFELKNVSFSLQKGSIMGFIGRNGAGKTTTLKCLLNLVHPDSGEISFFGRLRNEKNEDEIKQRIGFAAGGVDYYRVKPIKKIAAATASFYNSWNNDAYKKYMELFSLDESKAPKQLSDGMKVKFNLALALSHGAEALILDEPTSGLDPVSRNELLKIFTDLAKEGISVLFSTHITSDLDRCADCVTYIKSGRIIASGEKSDLIGSFGGGTLEDVMLNIEEDEAI